MAVVTQVTALSSVELGETLTEDTESGDDSGNLSGELG